MYIIASNISFFYVLQKCWYKDMIKFLPGIAPRYENNFLPGKELLKCSFVGGGGSKYIDVNDDNL